MYRKKLYKFVRAGQKNFHVTTGRLTKGDWGPSNTRPILSPVQLFFFPPSLCCVCVCVYNACMFVYIHVNKNYIRKAAREETRLRLATAQLVQFPSAGHCLRIPFEGLFIFLFHSLN